jgi:hypothetical protein
MPQNKLTIGYKLDGEVGEFTCEVEAFSDLRHATRELQLALIAKVLDIQPWVITRENVKEAS